MFFNHYQINAHSQSLFPSHTPLDDQGLHLVNNTFTVSDIRRTPRPPVLIMSVVLINGSEVPPSTGYNVCEITRKDNTTTFTKSEAFKVSISNVAKTCTIPDQRWIAQFGFEVLKGFNSSKLKYDLVVSTLPCSDIGRGSNIESYTSPVFTIVNDNGMSVIYCSVFIILSPLPPLCPHSYCD